MSGLTRMQQMVADAEVLGAAIAAGPPAGHSPAGDERYLELRMEVEKETTPSAGAVDWPKVAVLGTQVLRETAKDLFALAYLTHALQRTRGSAGLAVGILAMDLCVSRYWDTMFPPAARIKGRITPVQWFVSRVASGLASSEFGAADRPVLVAIGSALDRIKARCTEKLGEQAPSFDELMAGFAELLRSLPEGLRDSEVPAEVSVLSREATGTASVAKPGVDIPAGASRTRELAAMWLEPIEGPRPAGIDPLPTPEFGALQREVEKVQGLTPGTVDWPRVVGLAEQVLRVHAKDLRAACYLAFAWFRVGGLDGLSRGLALVAELLDQYWADLYPPLIRERTRVAPVAWLLERVEPTLLSFTPGPSDRPGIEQLREITARFLDVVRARFAEQVPVLRPLSQAIDQLWMSVAPEIVAPAAAPTPAPREPVVVAPKPGSAVSTPAARGVTERAPVASPSKVDLGVADVSSASAADKYLKGVGEQMTKTALEIRKVRPVDPLGYRLLRMGAWLHIAGPLKVGLDGSIGVTGVPDRDRQLLETARAEKRWANVITMSESLFLANRFVIDLHRMTTEALRELGPEHEPAARGVILELRNFLARVPELITATDGRRRPFGDEATQAWLAKEVLLGGASAPPLVDETAPGVEPDKGLAEAVDQALVDLREPSKRTGALKAALQWVQALPAAQTRFLRRLELAETCMEIGEWRLAVSLFIGVLHDVHEFRLNMWDPPLAARCLEGLVRAVSRAKPLGAGLEERRLAEETLGELTRVDPTRAAQLAEEIFSGKMRA